MHFRKVGDREHLVVLERDEKVVASLQRFAADHGIQGGWVSGLGSVRHAEMGWYDASRRSYVRREFAEDMELTGAAGNLAMHGSDAVLHLHAGVSGPDLITLSGHLFEAKVAASAEFLVRDFGVRVDRAEAPESGLKVIQPEKPPKKEPKS